MERFILLLFALGISFSGIAQDCPTGNGGGTAARVANGANHQIYLEWPDEASATAMYDALQGGMLQTAITLNGVVNEGAANEEIINNVELSKAELIRPSGNPFRIRSNIPVTSNFNGEFTGTVTFNFNSGAGGGTLTCTFSAGILPIELASFTATSMQREVMVKWQTSTEINNDYMAVERSADGRNFTEIGRLPGAGNSNTLLSYELVDDQPFSGRNYYRLRQVDFDGTTSYSEVRSINLQAAAGSEEMAVYPTVVSRGSELTVDLRAVEAEVVVLALYDVNGKQIKAYEFSGGTQTVLPVAGLESGIYWLENKTQISQKATRFIIID